MIYALQNLESKGIESLLSYAVGPSMEKVKTVQKLYMHNPNWFLYGYEQEKELLGCIGIQLMKDGQAILQHISVKHDKRQTGIGSKMIREVIKLHSLRYIEAETDKDAVDFYKRYGFYITSLGEKYPGVERFQCILELH